MKKEAQKSISQRRLAGLVDESKGVPQEGKDPGNFDIEGGEDKEAQCHGLSRGQERSYK